MSNNIGVHSGQLWVQDAFPFCRRTVMLAGGPHVKMCMISGEDNAVPNIYSDENGKWLFTPDELLTRLQRLNYRLAGNTTMRTVMFDKDSAVTDVSERHGITIDRKGTE